jgi:hypothetical protein
MQMGQISADCLDKFADRLTVVRQDRDSDPQSDSLREACISGWTL